MVSLPRENREYAAIVECGAGGIGYRSAVNERGVVLISERTNVVQRSQILKTGISSLCFQESVEASGRGNCSNEQFHKGICETRPATHCGACECRNNFTGSCSNQELPAKKKADLSGSAF